MEPATARAYSTRENSRLSELELFAAYRNGAYKVMARCATPKCPELIEADEDTLFCTFCWLEMNDDRPA